MAAPRLETARLVMRPWRESDLEAWAAMCADERVMEFLGPVCDRAKARTDAARLQDRLDRNGYGWWALEVKSGATFAGCIALQEVPFEAHFTPVLEVGWRLAYAQWGVGYATEAARAALAFAFETLGREEVVAMTAAINVRSQSVMQRLGMTRDPRDDFENPRVEPGRPLRPHVLYRAAKSRYARETPVWSGAI